jgi:hypothetical protein
MIFICLSQWPRGVRRRSTSSSPTATFSSNLTGGMAVCCVLSGTGLCDELITRPEKSYRLARRCG